MKRAFSLLLSLSLISQAFAGTLNVQETTLSMNRTDGGAIADIVVPAGTQGEIVDCADMPAGNEAVKIKVTYVNEGTDSQLKPGQFVWLYHSLSEKDELMTLWKDKEKKLSVGHCKYALSATADKTFQIQNRVVVKTPNTVPSSVYCPPETPVSAQNALSIRDQIKCLKDYTHFSILKIDPSEKEIKTYLDLITANDQNKKNDKTDDHEAIAKNIKRFAEEKNIPIPLVLSMMKNESQYDRFAKSQKGAKGLIQLMPETAAMMAGAKPREITKNVKMKVNGKTTWTRVKAYSYLDKNGRILDDKGRVVDLNNIQTNIQLSMKYLSKLMQDYNHDLRKVIMAYDMGEGGLSKFEATGGREKDLSQETRDYVNKRIPAFLNEYNMIMQRTDLLLGDPVKYAFK